MDVKEKKMEENFKYHIPEDIPANERTAFHGAAAAAAKAGKKKFNFGGKTHPVTMKKDTAKAITSDTKKESTMTFREKLVALYEGDRAAHYKGATEPEGMHDKSKSSKGAMDMLNIPKSTEADGMKAAKDTAANIQKSAPGKKLRKGDQNKGDLTIKPSATPVKDPSAKTQTAEEVDKLRISMSGKSMSQLLDAVNQVTQEGSIKGSGTDRKAVLKKAFRAGEKQDQSAFTGKKPAIRAPKGMKGRMKSGKMDAFSAKHKDKGVEKAYQAGFHGDYSGNKPEKGKARMKPQSNFPLSKDQMKARKMMRGN